MSDNITFPNGKTYIGHDYLTCGDYGGASSVGVANIRSVLEQFEGRVEEWSYGKLYDEGKGQPSLYIPGDNKWEHQLPEAPCLHVTGGHGSETIYLLEGGEDCDEILASLEDYPCLDDEKVSEVELEWEDEAWNSWLCSDLVSAIKDEELKEWAEDSANADDPKRLFWDAYRAAMEETNTYPEAEYDGVHVDVDRIAGAFEQHLRGLRLEDEHAARKAEAEAAGQMELPL